MRTGSATATNLPALDQQSFAARRSTDYGGLVGDLLTEIEARMTVSPSAQAITAPTSGSVDPVHLISIAAGYLGLAAGFAATSAVILWALA